MSNSICGVDCAKCELKENCKGCINTNGRPFDGECLIANCCHNKKNKNCKECSACELKRKIIKEFNELGIKNMPEVAELNALSGSFVNLEYTLPSGQTFKLLDDKKIYLGNQIPKENTDRCYGLVADDSYLLVCEYGINASNPEVIIYKKLDLPL